MTGLGPYDADERREKARSTVRPAACCAVCKYRKTRVRSAIRNWCILADEERDLYETCDEYQKGPGIAAPYRVGGRR